MLWGGLYRFGWARTCFTLLLMTVLLTALYSFGILVREDSLPLYTPGTCTRAFSTAARNKVQVNADESSSMNDSIYNLMPGGHYKPEDCEPKYRVAIIVPYRDREEHLKIFLRHMHPFLQRQRLDYAIFVVEMLPGVKFNRALLMNIGFEESSRQYDYQCFIFHDVDLLPENDGIEYTCTSSPAHLSVAIDSKHYRMPYDNYFGGVCAISKQHFKMINGFSNIYFDWGGEDDDISDRLKFRNLEVKRLSNDVGRFKMLSHSNAKQNPDKNILFKTMKARFQTDGLNSLKYLLVKYELKRLYTWILVSVNETEVVDNEPIHKASFTISVK